MHRVSPATFLILPMLGKHPDEYQRFRDCFLGDEEYPQYDNHIHVYTRVGGGNRDYYHGSIKEMQYMETYVTDYDDSTDSTYATFVFRVPLKWKADFDLINNGELKNVSKEYQDELIRVYPKLKDKFTEMFEKKN